MNFFSIPTLFLSEKGVSSESSFTRERGRYVKMLFPCFSAILARKHVTLLFIRKGHFSFANLKRDLLKVFPAKSEISLSSFSTGKKPKSSVKRTGMMDELN